MKEHFIYFANAFVAMFVILDPFAVVPVYLLLTDRFTEEETRRTRRKASIMACLILVVFAVTGMRIFNLFGITLPAFQIAGGILLLLLGLSQLNADRNRVRQSEQNEGLSKEDVSIFPLAMPLIAGPGAISTVVLQAGHAKGFISVCLLVLAILSATLINYVVLKFAPILFKVLGQTGLNLITRIMGVILTAIAIQFMLNGIKDALPLIMQFQ